MPSISGTRTVQNVLAENLLLVQQQASSHQLLHNAIW